MEGVSKSCGLDLHLVSSVRQRLDLLTVNPKGTEGSEARRNKRPNKVGCVDGVVILYEGFCCSVLRSDMRRGLRGYSKMPATHTAPPDMNCVAGTITSNTITLPPQAQLSIRLCFLNMSMWCWLSERIGHSNSVPEKP